MENNCSSILEGLNNEQKLAVSSVDGPVLIVAGAGSGKTRVLTSRIAYILEKGCAPEKVLALTFTKKAASEMKERIAVMVGNKKARKLYMGTFHSVFIRFLREFAESLGYPETFTIYDTSDSVSAIKACVKELQLDDKIYKPKDVLNRISMAKNNLVTADAYARNYQAIQNDSACRKPRITDIYRLYANKCKQAGVMDFDDILLNMNILLRDNPDALESIADRFDYIMVDEYQDTNFSQYLILKKLAARHRNICVVGDDSQSIYAFRGAKIENILNFQKDYPDNKTFRLEQNYRSTRIIVDAANSLIAKNSSRIPKKCFSEGDEGEKIKLIQAYTEQEEAQLISYSILARMRTDHALYQDFAILYRTNSQSRAIEEALRKKNIPYVIYSGNSFYERAEVKDMMAYFKLAVNPNDDESFKRVVNKPARGIGDTTMAALSAAALNKRLPLARTVFEEDLESFGLKKAAIERLRSFATMMVGFWKRSADEDAHKIATSIALDSGLLMSFKSSTTIEDQARASNIEELLNSVKVYVEERHNEEFEEMQADESISEGAEMAESDFTTVLLPDFLENVSLLSAVDMEDDEDANNKVALMTVHSSKGLEFPYVYVAGMEENLFPSGGSMSSESEIEEERRLFYVAVTRAKKAVQFSFATTRMRNGKHESNSPSRFIREVDPQYIENPLSAGGEKSVIGSNTSTSARFGRFGGNNSNRYGNNNGKYNYGQSSAPVKVPKNTEQESRKTTVFRKPSAIVPRTSDSDFTPTPVMDLRAGQKIEHNRFGFGQILEISGSGNDLKAKMQFDNYGEKILLLKYAKVRVLNNE